MDSQLIVCLIVGFYVGFGFYCITAPKQGENKHLSLIIPIPCTQKGLHIHHWIYLLAAYPFVLAYPLAVGFCLGGILQSFVWYDDSFDIVVPRYPAPAPSPEAATPSDLA